MYTSNASESEERQKRIKARHAAKRKKKLIFMLIFLSGLIIIASRTTLGADIMRSHAKDNPESSLSKFLLKDACELYRFWSDNYKAARAYGDFLKIYGDDLSEEELLEARYYEILGYYDSRQYITAQDKLYDFWDIYDPEERDEIIKKADNLDFQIRSMGSSKRVDDLSMQNDF